jgi:hypothetical protein
MSTYRPNTGIVLYYPPKPTQVFEQFAFWSLLNAAQQTELQEEITNLLTARTNLGLSTIEIGQRLVAIRELLASHKGAFSQLLEATHFSSRTGRRYIRDYKRLLKYLPESVLTVMKSHGFRLLGATRDRPLGDYTEAYQALVSANELPIGDPVGYVSKLEAQYECLKADPHALSLVKKEKIGDPAIKALRNSEDFLQKQCHHFLKSTLRRLPATRRDVFLERHVGYLLTLRGVTGKRFEAQAIPSRYSRPPGRPSEEEVG